MYPPLSSKPRYSKPICPLLVAGVILVILSFNFLALASVFLNLSLLVAFITTGSVSKRVFSKSDSGKSEEVTSDSKPVSTAWFTDVATAVSFTTSSVFAGSTDQALLKVFKSVFCPSLAIS